MLLALVALLMGTFLLANVCPVLLTFSIRFDLFLTTTPHTKASRGLQQRKLVADQIRFKNGTGPSQNNGAQLEQVNRVKTAFDGFRAIGRSLKDPRRSLFSEQHYVCCEGWVTKAPNSGAEGPRVIVQETPSIAATSYISATGPSMRNQATTAPEFRSTI